MKSALWRTGILVGTVVAFFGPAWAQQPAVTPPPAPAAAPQAAAPAPTTVVARVNGEAITYQDVVDQVRALPPQYQQQASALYVPIVNRLVDFKLLNNRIKGEKLEDDPEYQKRLAQSKAEIAREVFLRRYVAAKVTEEMVKTTYDNLVKSTPPEPEIRVSHILFADEKSARDAIAQLKKGGDFAKMAEAKSTDKGTASRGGDLGYIVKSTTVKEFSDAAFALKVGEISAKPVKTQFGWHIIKVTDKRDRTVPPYAQLKNQLRQKVEEQEAENLVEDLKKTAKIEIFNLDGTPVSPPAPQTQPGAQAPTQKQ
ncbi:MAG TPA: peptidylprolyl isomerase [Dongiaceae bacterium]|nr:peptidylprolyl isomerase [Dongiaceae bacterium]